MKSKLLPILIVTTFLMLVAACTKSGTEQENDEMGVVYRSPT